MEKKVMQENRFKIGSVVKLTSGGPNMTVDDIKPYEGAERIVCIWFERGRKYEAAFKPGTLTVISHLDPD
jgi:uncharacterized protein YodC (DUF2158 family)